jgi:hypothetical protein
MTSRFPNRRKLAGLAATAAVLTAAGSGLGAGMAQADTTCPDADMRIGQVCDRIDNRVGRVFDRIDNRVDRVVDRVDARFDRIFD